MHSLAQAGVLDSLRGNLTRRDLLLQITELHRQYRGRPLGDGQLPIALSDDHTAAPSGLPEMTSREALNAELNILGADISRHLMDHHQLLHEFGATDAAHLPRLRPGQQVLVAGVRASTQTPPIASGKRIIFVTLEDGTGLVDLAFFEDFQDACAHTVFHSGLLLVRGHIQRRGQRSTVTGQMAWDLEHLATTRRDHRPEAVQRLLGADAHVPAAPRTEPHRTITHETARPSTPGLTYSPSATAPPTSSNSATPAPVLQADSCLTRHANACPRGGRTGFGRGCGGEKRQRRLWPESPRSRRRAVAELTSLLAPAMAAAGGRGRRVGAVSG